ncbi:hypothetical protein AAFP35_16890 [Gordonia sp. CPCC 206044]|uniref:hypothetical protein n=1 Tax=Gordonia sp. CPCC 206044 TaxID=3140793 RepID=UPI003AF3E351
MTREDGWWMIRVPELVDSFDGEPVLTQAHGLIGVDPMARELISLVAHVPSSEIALGLNIELPADDRDDERLTEKSGPVEIEIDGEIFTVTVHQPGEFSYDWNTGPNDYGFGSGVRSVGGPVPQEHLYPPLSVHRDSCARFLAQIDPDTGYLAD